MLRGKIHNATPMTGMYEAAERETAHGIDVRHEQPSEGGTENARKAELSGIQRESLSDPRPLDD